MPETAQLNFEIEADFQPTGDQPQAVDNLVDGLREGLTIGAANGSLSVYHPADGLTWFYKMSGPSDVVTAEKGAFMEFVQSIRFPKP